MFEVQDAGSQKIAEFLEVKEGMRVVDACAGAGGKTLHLAAMMHNKGQIIALDIHEWKLAELKRRAKRAGAHNIETRVITDTKVIKRLHDKGVHTLCDVTTFCRFYRKDPAEAMARIGLDRAALLKDVGHS